MVNIEKGIELDLYLSKLSGMQDKTRLWVSSQLFNDKQLRKQVIDFLADSIKKIKGIKKFNNVEMLEFRFKDETTKKKTIYRFDSF